VPTNKRRTYTNMYIIYFMRLENKSIEFILYIPNTRIGARIIHTWEWGGGGLGILNFDNLFTTHGERLYVYKYIIYYIPCTYKNILFYAYAYYYV